MAVNKKHEEFHTLDMNSGWEIPVGYPSGIQQKILSGALAFLLARPLLLWRFGELR